MELFEIIVGMSTIISTVCSVISMVLLQSLSVQLRTNGNENIFNVSQSHGIGNTTVNETTKGRSRI